MKGANKMKKIINGKMYNTETAHQVDMWSNGVACRDFRQCCEMLYRKKTGEFFIHGWGGPMSKYAESQGNEISGSEKIIPITEAEAKAWLEEKGTTEAYIETFGEPEE